MNTQKIIILSVGILVVVLLGVFISKTNSLKTGSVSVINLQTSSSNTTHTTSTVNTTSTQVFASITKIAEIINDSAGKLTCSMDATNTTAASSTVSAGRGIIIVPSASSTSNLPNVVRFGECSGEGNIPCYPHKGAVNCLSNVAASISKWSK